jgi:hypothetical protein
MSELLAVWFLTGLIVLFSAFVFLAVFYCAKKILYLIEDIKLWKRARAIK